MALQKSDFIFFSNCALDLKDSKRKKHKRDEEQIYICLNLNLPVKDVDTSPVEIFFESFFEDVSMVKFFQVLLGYFLSDGNEEGDVFCLHGDSGTGKTQIFKFLVDSFSPYFGSFNHQDINVMISSITDSKKSESMLEKYFKQRRLNLVDISNKRIVTTLLPFLKLKSHHKIPHNGKILAFTCGMENKILDKYGDAAFFIPLRFKFVENPGEKFERKAKDFSKMDLKFQMISWVSQGSELYYRYGLKAFIPSD